MEFCVQRQLNPLQTSANLVLEFFTSLFSTRGYSALNTARAALSSIVVLGDGYTISNHPFIVRFFKGVFNLKPTLPRYTQVWDVRVVFNYLRKLSPVKSLDLQQLTLKTCMLLAMLTAQRQQTLHCLNVEDMDITSDKFIFRVNNILKTSKPGNIGVTIELEAYPLDRRLCIYTHLIEYLKRTKICRGKVKQLLISYRKPHFGVSVDTIARWLRLVMQKAGLPVDKFKPHSIRTAAVSNARVAQVPIKDIMSRAGWKNEQTFYKFYNKPVIQTQREFASALLKD